MSTVLDLLLYLRRGHDGDKSFRCVWHGSAEPATWKEMRDYAEKRARPPALLRSTVSLECRGDAMLGSQISQRRFQHATRFFSTVPLDVTSPARAVAVFVLVRLFPRKWRDFYKLAFRQDVSERAAATANRYNAVLAEPTNHELLELAALHVAFVRASKEDEKTLVGVRSDLFMGVRDLVAPCFGEHKNARFRLTLFLSISAYALTRKARESFADFLRLFGSETFRNIDRLLACWVVETRVPADAYVPCAISQFRLNQQ